MDEPKYLLTNKDDIVFFEISHYGWDEKEANKIGNSYHDKILIHENKEYKVIGHDLMKGSFGFVGDIKIRRK